VKNRLFIPALAGIAFLIVVSGCSQPGGGSTSPAPTGLTATVTSVTASGDFVMSGAISMTGYAMAVNLAAIKDPADPSKPLDPSLVTISGTAESGIKVTFSMSKLSASSSTPIDLVFINDTTGSMSGTTLGILSSIDSFTSAISASGVDGQFSMYTYGDAFATKLSTGSEFAVGKGDFTPPTIDPDERPYIGLGTYATFKSFLNELKNSSSLGSGGGDNPENTVGTLDYANKHVAFRDGAARVFVVIGDNPSHQFGDPDVSSYPTAFQPRTGAAVAADLVGLATGHVIGETSTSTTYYPLQNLATSTGGGFIILPSGGTVDLNTLKITDWIKSGFTGTTPALSKGTYKVTLSAVYTPTSGAAKAATLVFMVDIT
jgi:hypothetical protein